MMDNLECENLLIDQYIKLRLERCQQAVSYAEVVRLPFLVFVYCRSVFKRESHICEYLFKKISLVFYFRECSLPKGDRENEGNECYRKLLLATKDSKAFYIAQINVRCMLLGLSVKMGKKQVQIYRQSFMELVNNLKIELMFNCNQTLSDLLLKELELMKNEFDYLEYYQELKTSFQMVDNIKIVEWTQSILLAKRKQFQQKSQLFLPFKSNQTKEESKEEVKKEGIKIKQPPIQQKLREKDTVLKSFPNKLVHKNSKETKEIRSKTPNVIEKKVSYISLANQQRKSVSGLSTRFSGKYIFKSTKKESQNQIYEYYQQNSDDENPYELFLDKKMSTQQQLRKVEFLAENDDQYNGVLCPATPPRTNRKVQLK